MGLFGPSKAERAAATAGHVERASKYAAEARHLRASAQQVRENDRRSKYHDPAAVRAITGRLEEDAREADSDARYHRHAAELSNKRWR